MNPSHNGRPHPARCLMDRLFHQSAIFILSLMLACAVNADSNSAAEDESILQNPGFELWKTFRAQTYPISWSPQQHTGDISFSFSRDEEDFVSGISSLRIERIGTQPWGSVTQVIPPAKLKGKRVRFSVEARMDETTPDGLSLMLVVKGVGVGGSPIYTRKFDGISSWQNVSIEGEVPKSATRITVGMTLESGRVLWLDDAQIKVLP